MILIAAVFVAVGYAIYKHVGLATISADVKSAVAAAEKSVTDTVSAPAIVAQIKADLVKYLS